MRITAALILLAGIISAGAVDRYVSLSGGHVPPFTNWVDAATNIQAAVDAAVAGDTVWVTNGLYNTGGKVMAGDLTNRVAIDKAITVQSVNGPSVTVIEGASGGETNPVRCVWMSDGAVLSGFAVQRGQTQTSGDSETQQRGGGIWCNSTSSLITDCWVRYNRAWSQGGGVYRGTVTDSTIFVNSTSAGPGGGASSSVLDGCVLRGNDARSPGGGGAHLSTLRGCAIIGNSASSGSGGGAFDSSLTNCTIAFNSSPVGSGGGVFVTSIAAYSVRNCIVYSNSASDFAGGANYNTSAGFGSIQYSCTTPLPVAGSGNISSQPQLLSDGIHLAETSPCRGAGNASFGGGTDIDGQAWLNPPAMGCDEWYGEPVVTSIQFRDPEINHSGGNGQIGVKVLTFGPEPLGLSWRKNGVPLTEGGVFSGTDTEELLVHVNDPLAAGTYDVVATNVYGATTSRVVQLTLHLVSSQASNPTPPFATWATAAHVIQDAVDAAIDGAVVVVTNGIYSTGGRPLLGGVTNRVAVERRLTLVSLNGPNFTTIVGAWDPITTNGPLAVRCIHARGSLMVKGLTLRDGATASTAELYGGGAIGGDLRNCRIVNCRAAGEGGGSLFGRLSNCEVSGNSASEGGGVYGGVLYNCTITRNTATVSGGGTRLGVTRNSIVFFNTAPTGPNYQSGAMQYSCSTPLPSGTGNIDADPLLLGPFRLSPDSPGRAGGSTNYSVGVDLEGQPWLNPPSMGCDEVYEADFVGPLAVTIEVTDTNVVQGVPLSMVGVIDGLASGLAWDFGDGVVSSNLSYLTTHAWTNPGDYPVDFSAYNLDNPGGVGSNLTIHVVPLLEPKLSAGSLSSNTFTLNLVTQPGVTYAIEQSTNLTPPVVWSLARSVVGTGDPVPVSDTTATNEMRFYRARVP